jgi:RNA methyltransferase, TrmH family
MLNNRILISKTDIKFIRSLHDKKNRQEQQVFIVEGDKMIHELLHSKVYKLHSLYATATFITQQNALISSISTEKVKLVSAKELSQISLLQTPNNCLALVHFTATKTPKIINDKKYILLDNIKDPGNLGTIIRTADWFGIDTIFCSPECVENTNPKVVQATMGSFFRVQIIKQSLFDIINDHPQMPVIGAILDGQNLYHTKFTEGAFLVIGSESHGISDTLKPLLSQKVMIPSLGEAESLNASLATGIICSEWVRQINFSSN